MSLKTVLTVLLVLLLIALGSVYGRSPREAQASFVATGYGPFSPETQMLVEDRCGYSMAESAFYEYTQTRKGYLAMLKVHEGVGDLYRCVKSTTKEAPIPDNDSFYSNSSLDPNAHAPGYAQAEDGSWVPESYWDAAPKTGTILAEDGSYVNPDFYSRTDYNRNGVTDQEEGYPPNPNPASVY